MSIRRKREYGRKQTNKNNRAARYLFHLNLSKIWRIRCIVCKMQLLLRFLQIHFLPWISSQCSLCFVYLVSSNVSLIWPGKRWMENMFGYVVFENVVTGMLSCVLFVYGFFCCCWKIGCKLQIICRYFNVYCLSSVCEACTN